MEGDKGGKKRKGHQGTCIMDPWTRTMVGGRIECGRWGRVGQGRVMEGGNGDNCN